MNAENATDQTGKIWNGRLFSVRWLNTGQSPALDAHVFISTRYVPVGEPVPVFPRIDGDSLAVVGPGRDTHTGQLFLAEDENWAAYRAGAKRLILYSRSEYRDVFSPELHHTEYCCEVVFDGVVAEGDEQRDRILFRVLSQQNTIS